MKARSRCPTITWERERKTRDLARNGGLGKELREDDPMTSPGRSQSTSEEMREETMAKASHTEAADHHEKAARSHRAAAEHHDKGDAATASKHATEAHGHSSGPHEASTKANGRSTAK